MGQRAKRYGQALFGLDISDAALEETERIWCESPRLREVLEDPEIWTEDKLRAADRIFPKETKSLVKLMCKNGDISSLEEAVEVCRECKNKERQTLSATLSFVTPPSSGQLDGIRGFLRKKYNVRDVEINMIKDPSLIGGFILSAEGCEFDWSVSGRIAQLSRKIVGKEVRL